MTIECRSAQRYVHTYRGLVNKPPGRTLRLAHFVRALIKVNPVGLWVTETDVPCVWVAQHSRRKLQGTRQQQPGLLARALPLQGRCHRFESGSSTDAVVESGFYLPLPCPYDEVPVLAESCLYTYSCLRKYRNPKTP